MIKFDKETPTVYYKQSRDFQLLGRLYELVLNSVKTNSDLLYYLPLGLNSSLDAVDLLATTLGFTPRSKYNAKQLQAVCSVLPTILKYKGSLQAIITLVNTILHAEGITDSLECFEKTDDDGNKEPAIVIAIPDKLKDLNLIYDLLDYILPAGISCEIISILSLHISGETNLEVVDTLRLYSNEVSYADGQTADDVAKISNFADLSDPATRKQLIEADTSQIVEYDPISGKPIYGTKQGLQIHDGINIKKDSNTTGGNN